MVYNLSILCVDGETIYSMIGADKKSVLSFLQKYDHEGSGVTLVKHEGENFINIENPEEIYKELGFVEGVMKMEQNSTPRKRFEQRMKQGVRPIIFSLERLAGGEYVSIFTEMAWKEFLAGWQGATEEYC